MAAALVPLIDAVKTCKADATSRLASGLIVLHSTEQRGIEAVVYEPLICLILQGSKEVSVGPRSARVRAGQAIVVSHDLPVVSRILEASPERPYLALVATLDVAELRGLSVEMGLAAPERRPTTALDVRPVSDEIAAVLHRYASLGDGPEVAVLGPLVRRELHVRLLQADVGGTLRALASVSSHASRIAEAIRALRAGFRDPVEVTALARSVGMSRSSFHRHFKDVTSTTPLQYQKDLRLSEARRLLLAGRHSVSSAAYEVGYESPSQFSREYARKFGGPPRTDLAVGA